MLTNIQYFFTSFNSGQTMNNRTNFKKTIKFGFGGANFTHLTKSTYKWPRWPQIVLYGYIFNQNLFTAAHCFWSDVDKQLPASLFAVAAGKLYRPWNSPKDVDAQKSDVSNFLREFFYLFSKYFINFKMFF